MARRSALLIACNKFGEEFSPLQAPVREAEELSAVLQDESIGGFDVKLMCNQTSSEILEAIHAFFDNSTVDDTLLLYLAGHGTLDSRSKFHFVATNTKKRTLTLNGVRGDFIHEQLQECRSNQKILVVDCCFSGAVATGYFPRGEEAVDMRRMATKGTVVLAASDRFEHAFERATSGDEPPRSVFSSRLIEGLQSGDADLDLDGRISTDELYDYLATRIRREDSAQNPIKAGVMDGMLVIANVRPEVHRERRRQKDQQREEAEAIERQIERSRLADELERERALRVLAESEKQSVEQAKREHAQLVDKLRRQLTQADAQFKAERELRDRAEKQRTSDALDAQRERQNRAFWQDRYMSLSSTLEVPRVLSVLASAEHRRGICERLGHIRRSEEEELNERRINEWRQRLEVYGRQRTGSRASFTSSARVHPWWHLAVPGAWPVALLLFVVAFMVLVILIAALTWFLRYGLR